jgi:hypothetical protein
MVDRCFEHLNGHYSGNPVRWKTAPGARTPLWKAAIGTETNFQEVVALRERGWEGLPPLSVFTTNKAKFTGANQKDPAATPC